MTPAQEQMALDAVRGTLNLHPEPNALGAARIRIHSSDGGSRERPFDPADAAGVKSGSVITRRANRKAEPGLEIGASKMPGSSMSFGLAEPIVAGQAPSPSESFARARAARVFALTFFAAFGVATAIPLIILAHLIDWTGVAESVGLY
jgi:hypothetical protein